MLPHALEACPETPSSYAEDIRRIVDQFPPLTPAKLDELALILGFTSVAPAAAA